LAKFPLWKKCSLNEIVNFKKKVEKFDKFQLITDMYKDRVKLKWLA
jgi:hypothetical protein